MTQGGDPLQIEEWIKEVVTALYPALRQDSRFKNPEDLIGRFDGHAADWRQGGQLRPLIEDGNELAAAAAMLARGNDPMEMRYEPRLANTQKRIDFGFIWPDGSRSWVEVKTVAPQFTDDAASWTRFQTMAAAFPANAHLIVDSAMLGAGISAQEIKARWTFIRRVQELEEKAALLSPNEAGPVRLIFCSNGDFRSDALEDFADFYRTGRFRQDDWARNAVQQFLTDENIAYTRTLAGLCYLKRDHANAFASNLRLDIRGPDLP